MEFFPIDTYRIYEDLRLTLGEEAAKSLAHTLGPMFEEARNAVTKTEFRELCAAIETRNAVVDTGFARLADAQSRTEAKVSELAVALGSLTNTVQRLSIRTDAVVGRTFELLFRGRLSFYLGRFLRRSKLLRNDELLDDIESVLDSAECDEVLLGDAIASGPVDGEILVLAHADRRPPPGPTLLCLAGVEPEAENADDNAGAENAPANAPFSETFPCTRSFPPVLRPESSPPVPRRSRSP